MAVSSELYLDSKPDALILSDRDVALRALKKWGLLFPLFFGVLYFLYPPMFTYASLILVGLLLVLSGRSLTSARFDKRSGEFQIRQGVFPIAKSYEGKAQQIQKIILKRYSLGPEGEAEVLLISPDWKREISLGLHKIDESEELQKSLSQFLNVPADVTEVHS